MLRSSFWIYQNFGFQQAIFQRLISRCICVIVLNYSIIGLPDSWHSPFQKYASPGIFCDFLTVFCHVNVETHFTSMNVTGEHLYRKPMRHLFLFSFLLASKVKFLVKTQVVSCQTLLNCQYFTNFFLNQIFQNFSRQNASG